MHNRKIAIQDSIGDVSELSLPSDSLELPESNSTGVESTQHQFSDYTLRSNDIISNRFKLLHELGEGGFGSVWKAHDILLDNEVALKVQKSTSDTKVNMLRKEVLALRELPKDRFVSVFDYVEMGVPRIIGYTMELLHNPWNTLTIFLGGNNLYRGKYFNLSNNTKQLKVYLNMVLELLESISILHSKGYIHRDLKPDNIHINVKHIKALYRTEWASEDIIPIMKIGDLGLVTNAKNVEGYGGTPAFGPKEQFNPYSLHVQSYKSDLCAIGRTLYYLMTSRILDHDNCGKATKIKPAIFEIVNSKFVSDKIANVIAKLTVNNPKQRYANAAKAKLDILKIFKDEEQIIYYDAMLNLNSSYKIKDIPEAVFDSVKSYYGWQRINKDRKAKIQVKIREYQRDGMIKLSGQQYSLA